MIFFLCVILPFFTNVIFILIISRSLSYIYIQIDNSVLLFKPNEFDDAGDEEMEEQDAEVEKEEVEKEVEKEEEDQVQEQEGDDKANVSAVLNYNEAESELTGKTKKVRGTYKPIKKAGNLESLEAYIRTANKHKIIITNNEPKPCSLCGDNKHEMTQIYLKCICKRQNRSSTCNLK